jgi:UDP-N-acetylglucosamine--N-acetylmuramyl-(pentapeptide) pyrophosphoryl-undecaprenol N-acetylglucosamine transferase
VFVPFPSAVDDHQTTNARFLVEAGGGWLVQQRDLSAEWLAGMIRNTQRPELIRRALAARSMGKTSATAEMIKACEELAKP